jgi:hypothetical protein
MSTARIFGRKWRRQNNASAGLQHVVVGLFNSGVWCQKDKDAFNSLGADKQLTPVGPVLFLTHLKSGQV